MLEPASLYDEKQMNFSRAGAARLRSHHGRNHEVDFKWWR